MSRRKKTILATAIIVVLAIAAAATLWQNGLASPAPWLTLAAAALVPLLLRREICQDFIAWREDFGVGFPLIDGDHKKLLSLINNLLATQQCETGTALERQALDELLDYTEYHFKREEDLMTRYGYPDFAEHKAQHDRMRAQVQAHLKRYEEKGRVALPQLANHLKLWLLQHIAGTDRRLAPFLARQAGLGAGSETQTES
jgi:hemerythrin